MKRTIALAGLSIALISAAIAQHPHGHGHRPSAQPYAGQQTRAITSLSQEEVDGYLAGAGMGLARAAELNGFPGPMHVLELDRELALDETQRQRVKAAMDAVKAKTRALGAKYVEAEKAVDDAFRANAPRDVIAAKVADAGRLLAEIRQAHLDAHLEITPLLSETQRKRYTELRGYAGGTGHGGHGAHGKHKH
jgi:hypothetical protein